MVYELSLGQFLVIPVGLSPLLPVGDEGHDLWLQSKSFVISFEQRRPRPTVALACCARLGTEAVSSTQMFHLFRMHLEFPGGHL